MRDRRGAMMGGAIDEQKRKAHPKTVELGRIETNMLKAPAGWDGGTMERKT
jgi:hypothetical protein